MNNHPTCEECRHWTKRDVLDWKDRTDENEVLIKGVHGVCERFDNWATYTDMAVTDGHGVISDPAYPTEHLPVELGEAGLITRPTFYCAEFALREKQSSTTN